MKPTLIFLLLLSASAVSAQRGIRLTSRTNHRQKFFPEGSRVVYEYTNSSHPLAVSYSRYGPVYRGVHGIGILHILSDSTFMVDDELIETKDLILLGKKKKGAWVGSFALITGGFWMVIASKSIDSDSGKAKFDGGLLSLGLAFYCIGLIDGFSRIPKNTSVWRAEIVK